MQLLQEQAEHGPTRRLCLRGYASGKARYNERSVSGIDNGIVGIDNRTHLRVNELSSLIPPLAPS